MLSHLGTIQPLKSGQLEKLTSALTELNAEQKIWLSGFLAGQALNHKPDQINELATTAQVKPQLTVLYGSQTGNAQTLAEQFKSEAESKGIATTLISLADYKPRSILKEQYVVLLVSTHGEGDPPDDAEIFHEFIFADKAPDLSKLSYAVLALGDSSYEQFCQTGIEFDQQLEKLGATRLVDRVDCDLDFAEDAQQWQLQTLTKLSENIEIIGAPASNVVPLAEYQTTKFNRQNPFSAEVITTQKITADDSVKNIHHIELSLEDSGINYTPGDSLAVLAKNPKAHVQQLITQLNLDSQEQVIINNKTLTFEQALIGHKEISLLNRKFLNFVAEQTSHAELQQILNTQTDFEKFVTMRQLIDVIREYPINLTAQQWVDQLPNITPRSYSIASSLHANPEEVHLTVALVETQENRTGLVSGYLNQQLALGDEVEVYVEPNKHFRLPEDGDTPIIMIGPGTGVAPFRAFIQERDALGHRGENWLFFGNPNFASDFLYQLEWQKYIQTGALHHLDLAFSRDQTEKIYVQHRIQERAAQVWQWLERGAHIYLCGDKNHMAKDVEYALLQIIQQQGQLSEPQAQDFLKSLKRTKRYQKDVY